MRGIRDQIRSSALSYFSVHRTPSVIGLYPSFIRSSSGFSSIVCVIVDGAIIYNRYAELPIYF